MLETIFKLILCALPCYLCFGWCLQLAVVTGLHFPIVLAKARYHKIGTLTDLLLHYGVCLVYLL